MPLTDEQRKIFEAGFLAGIAASAEGWNGEFGISEPIEHNEKVLEDMRTALASFDQDTLHKE